MLSRCSHCDRPFVVANAKEPRCPHCGREDSSSPDSSSPEGGTADGARAADGRSAAAESAPDPSSAVVAEGAASTARSGSTSGASAPRKKGVRPPPPRFVDGRPAFEQTERSLLSRFFGTLADVCLRPVAFFTHLSREGAPGVTWFGYTCLLLGTVGQALWGLVSLPFVRAMMERARGGLSPQELEAARAEDNTLVNLLLDVMKSGDEMVAQLSLVEAQLWTMLVLAPLTAFFAIHLLAGLVHYSVQSFRPPGEEPVPYDVTYRFLVYAFAPMVFGVLPTVGSFAGPFSFVLMFIAISRLHHVRVLGLIGGVLFPILLLSWLWDKEALPRLAPPLTRALGVVTETEPGAAPRTTTTTANDDEGGSEYPPMPPADRDHDVEVFEKGGWIYSERSWQSSLGRLHIRQLVSKDAGAGGAYSLVLEVKNEGEHDIGRFFVSHALPEGAALSNGDGAVRAELSSLVPGASDVAVETSVGDEEVSARYAELPRGATAVLAMKVKAASARALLQTAPAVGRDPAPAAEQAPETAP